MKEIKNHNTLLMKETRKTYHQEKNSIIIIYTVYTVFIQFLYSLYTSLFFEKFTKRFNSAKVLCLANYAPNVEKFGHGQMEDLHL